MNKGKAVGIAGGLSILAGALWAGWFFFIKTGQDDLAEARAEVVRWEQRVTEFRACMFGAKPLSGDSAEALALREMLPPTGEQQSCTKLAGKLNRGVANDTGNMKVEHAWRTVDRAASKVATAFAVYKSDYGVTEADRRRGVSDLPTALEELDTAREELRAAAGMPSVDTAGLQLPEADIIPVKGGGSPLRGFHTRRNPNGWDEADLASRNSIILFATGKSENQLWRVQHAAGGTPVVVEHAPSSTQSSPSLPTGDWHVNTTDSGPPPSALGIMGADLPPQTLTTSATPPTQITNTDSMVADVVALGAPANGIVVYTAHRPKSKAELIEETQISDNFPGPGRKLVIASTTGAFPAQSFPLREGQHAIDAQGNAIFAWTDPTTTTLRAAFLAPGAAPKVVELGTDVSQRLCMTTGYGWMTLFNGQVVRISPEGAVPMEVRHRLLGCGERAAVFHDIQDEFEVCAKDCRTVSLVGTGDTQMVAVSDEKVVAIRMRDKVLGVWVEGKQPVFYGLPDVLTPRAVVANGKVVDILANVNTVRPQDQQVLVVRVPMP